MQVILLQKVENLGNLGDVVKVKSGYGRNYLVPKGFATEASDANLKSFEERRKELEMAAADALSIAEVRCAELAGHTLYIPAKAGNEGRLYGSVGSADIVEAAAKGGIDIKRSQVRMDELIRQVGEYEVKIRLHTDVQGTVKVNVVPAK